MELEETSCIEGVDIQIRDEDFYGSSLYSTTGGGHQASTMDPNKLL